MVTVVEMLLALATVPVQLVRLISRIGNGGECDDRFRRVRPFAGRRICRHRPAPRARPRRSIDIAFGPWLPSTPRGWMQCQLRYHSVDGPASMDVGTSNCVDTKAIRP